LFCGSTIEPGRSNWYSDQGTAISVWGSNPDKKETSYSLLRNFRPGLGTHTASSSTETGDIARE